VFTLDQLIEHFSLDAVGSSASVFEESKLRWLNQQHMKRSDLERLVDLVKPFVLRRGNVTEEMWEGIGRDRLIRGADLLRDRSHTLEDLGWAMEILFPIPLDPVDEIEVTDRQAELMGGLADALEGLEPFTPEEIEKAIRGYLSSEGATLKDVALACRIAVTGRKAGPGLFQILAPIGAKTVSERLRSYPKGKRG